MSCRAYLLDAVKGAWRAFGCAPVPPRVDPSIPILFFGDLEAYYESDLRVVTVGLNPSVKEFPKFPDESPFFRFPLANGIMPDQHERYLDALSEYFRLNPYMGWFSAFEPILRGVGASYYGRRPSTALHTDICSPVATDPTWSELKWHYRDLQVELIAKGVPLWRTLIKALEPDIVITSIAKEHLSRIEFEEASDWEVIHEFDKKKSGEYRKEPYKVWAKYYKVCGKLTLFLFGRVAQKPFGSLSIEQRCEVGKAALEAWRHRGQ